MKIQFKKGVNAYSNGDVTYINKDKPFDVDARFGRRLIETGPFEEVKASKEEKKEKTKAKKALKKAPSATTITETKKEENK